MFCIMVKKREKFCLVLGIFIILSGNAFAVLLSDQGTNLRETATGNLTSIANLTISIYDSLAGGTKIFEENFTNGIANGSWNFIIYPIFHFF